MTLLSITLRDFRSYTEAAFAFSGGVNVISGPNGAGKTNLLEAIYYLATSKSARAARDADLIRFDRPGAEIGAAFVSGGREQALSVRLKRGGRRSFSLNGAALPSPRELMGVLPAVFFDPGGLSLLQGGAGERRAFIDAVLCQQKPRYLETLRRYRKLHESKTKLLSLAASQPAYLDMLSEYSRSLADTGAVLTSYRQPFIEELAPVAEGHHAAISGGRETLALRYHTRAADADEAFAKMEERRDAELARRQCLVGAHRDDVDAFLDGRPLKGTGSQGQTRTAAVAMKLAARDALAQTLGEPPLLLLDDVLSELDEMRQKYILGHIGGGQTFITCCEPGKITLTGTNITLG
ncbi:MAG: DNA replication and repair protein RecF [Oscillospiraceae bacterium]|jgi:DNA replication and repair protein RecF|nr:DNA replication and repair protein RecF [Oscillospiraceae bacterium]